MFWWQGGREDWSSRPSLAERDLGLGLPRRLGRGPEGNVTCRIPPRFYPWVTHARTGQRGLMRTDEEVGRGTRDSAARGELRPLLRCDAPRPPPPGARPHRRPARGAVGRARRVRRGLASLATGLPERRPARRGCVGGPGGWPSGVIPPARGTVRRSCPTSSSGCCEHSPCSPLPSAASWWPSRSPVWTCRPPPPSCTWTPSPPRPCCVAPPAPSPWGWTSAAPRGHLRLDTPPRPVKV